jgi:hypothetical protein
MNFLDLFTTETLVVPAASKADRRVASAIGVNQPPPQTIAMPTLPSQDSDETYQKLAAATSFETSDVGAKIQKYLTPLTGIPGMTAGMMFRTAVAQLKAQEGVSDVDILGTFHDLKGAVNAQVNAFDQKCGKFIETEVTTKLTRIEAAKAEMETLVNEIDQLTRDATAAHQKATTLQAQFQSAVARRNSEIEQQEAQTTALLKG